MADVAKEHGHVDVVLLAAGIEISRLLEQKEPREYDLVFDVKSDGWFNVLHGLAGTPVGATVAFSSVAGRFGNVGQTDYSAANDLLCKLTSNLRRTSPDVRGIVIDWTAWAGIGMATRGSIPTVMAAAGHRHAPGRCGYRDDPARAHGRRHPRRDRRRWAARHDGRRVRRDRRS